MTREDFVTYEQAVKLKELGFDECCYERYNVNKELEPNIIYNRTEVDSDDLCINVNGRNIGDISAPTLAQAQKWLREVKDIVVLATCSLDYEKGHEWYWFVDKDFDIEDPEHFFKTYEQALSVGIDKALKLLKQ